MKTKMSKIDIQVSSKTQEVSRYISKEDTVNYQDEISTNDGAVHVKNAYQNMDIEEKEYIREIAYDLYDDVVEYVKSEGYLLCEYIDHENLVKLIKNILT